MKRAFTLIELLVVITVMIILMAIMLPVIKSLTRNNNQKQAVNQLTSLIAHARSTAIQRHTPAGLVIYEDPVVLGQSSTQLVIQSGTVTGTNSAGALVTLWQFDRAPGAGSQPLPKGITVGMLDDSATTAVRTESSTAGTKARVVLFNENGQLVLANGFTRNPAVTDAASAAWNLNATFNTPSGGVSSPAVIVFNVNDMNAATDAGKITNANTRATWVQQNADILIVNAYTGNIIR